MLVANVLKTLIWRLAAPAAGVLLSISPGVGATVSFSQGGSPCADGLCSSVPSTHTITFNNAVSGPYVDGIATFSYGAGGSPFVSGSVAGKFAAPPNNDSTYLTVGSPGRANAVYVDFSRGINYYGFYLGSPDSYNMVSFFSKASDLNPIATFSGTELLPPATGNRQVGGYLNFFVNGGDVERIVLSSLTPALETDNHAFLSPVPEPASFGLAGAGVVLALAARRRKAAARS